MSPVYGVTPAGFVKKPEPVISAEVDADLKGILGDSAGTEPDQSIPAAGFAGQLKQWAVRKEVAHWDLQQAVYSSFDTRQNTGAAQDSTAQLTGTYRQKPTHSTVVGTLTGDPGAFIQAGKTVAVVVAGSLFDTDVDATLLALPAWVISTAYVVGDRRTNAGRCYICITPGTSAFSGGPTTTAADITDNSVHWRYLGQGTAALDVPCTAQVSGPLGAVSGTLTVVKTPAPGWRSAINLLDAVVGRNLENNTAFRLRRDSEVQATGNAATDAIRADVLRVGLGTDNPVLACRVFHNDTDTTDADGILPHSVEVLVEGGDDTLIAKSLLKTVAAGTRMLGTTPVVVQDSAGFDQTVRFTRPTLVPIWIIANVEYNPKTFPTDTAGASALLEAQLVFFGDAYSIGFSVRSTALQAQLFDGNSDELTPPVAGVLGVTSLLIGLVNPPVASTTIAIGPRALATFDTSRITINLTPGTP